MSAPSCRRGSPPRRWPCCARTSARTFGPIEDARTALEAELPTGLDTYQRYVFLGHGWTVGIAEEAALKLREAAQFHTEAYPAMEYRHGPISLADPGRLSG